MADSPQPVNPPAAPYDSALDTQAHVDRVRELLCQIEGRLAARGMVHDLSKFQEPEKSAFDRLTPILKTLTYGSPAYKAALVDLGPALQHHYQANSHHPEHFRKKCCIICFREFPAESVPNRCPFCLNGTFTDEGFDVGGMTLLDLVEMFCDWKAATERMRDGSLETSIQKNQERFKIQDQLARILENTRKEMGW